jgi:hypothetical protein
LRSPNSSSSGPFSSNSLKPYLEHLKYAANRTNKELDLSKCQDFLPKLQRMNESKGAIEKSIQNTLEEELSSSSMHFIREPKTDLVFNGM